MCVCACWHVLVCYVVIVVVIATVSVGVDALAFVHDSSTKKEEFCNRTQITLLEILSIAVLIYPKTISVN